MTEPATDVESATAVLGATIVDVGDGATLPGELDGAPRRELLDAEHGEAALGERYVVGKELGRGGMGRVNACVDRRIGRRVALKLLTDARPSQATKGRLIREARIQGQLEHPAIAPVYDLGDDGERGPWFTMKEIHGDTLEEVLADPEGAGWSPRRLLIAFLQVCRAVDFAHERGVLHRDLKPSNVMLGSYGEVYVLDWGVARLSETQRKSTPDHLAPATREGSVVGTMGYMAPEQAVGDLKNLGPASDVYALGAILFELLAGVALHVATTPSALFLSTTQPVEARVSVRAPERSVAPELEAIVVRATQLDATERHSSVGALVEDIERFLDGARDEAARQAQSARALESARAATAAALEERGDDRLRAEALGRLGQVLALDPDNADAFALLLELNRAPYETMPEEATESYLEHRSRQLQVVSRAACLGYLSHMLYVPLMFGVGLGLSWPMVVFVGGMLLAAAASGRVWRKGARSEWPILGTAAASYVAYAAISTLFGPLLFAPTLIALIATTYGLVLAEGWSRVASMAMAVLTLALTCIGWVLDPESSYTFIDGSLLIESRFVDLTPGATWAFLAASAIGNVLTGPIAIATLRDLIDRAERERLLETWEARAMSTARPTPRPASRA